MEATTRSLKASVETREDLLQQLDAPLGSVTIGRRASRDGDVIVVRMLSPSSLPANRRPSVYRGIPVEYVTIGPARAGKW